MGVCGSVGWCVDTGIFCGVSSTDGIPFSIYDESDMGSFVVIFVGFIGGKLVGSLLNELLG